MFYSFVVERTIGILRSEVGVRVEVLYFSLVVFSSSMLGACPVEHSS